MRTGTAFSAALPVRRSTHGFRSREDRVVVGVAEVVEPDVGDPGVLEEPVPPNEERLRPE